VNLDGRSEPCREPERGAQRRALMSEQKGGTTPDEAEAREKGPWAEKAGEGVVPVEGDGSDAVLGRTTGSDEPATDEGIDREAGDAADATRDAGPDVPADAEPDLKDVGAAQRRDEQ
jgi:hypothetical protein